MALDFRITITEEAERQFFARPVRDQRVLQAAIASRLRHHPTTITRAVKQLRPNPVAAYELRAGDLRVLYDVEVDEVIVSVVGLRVGNRPMRNSVDIKNVPLTQLEVDLAKNLTECADSGSILVVQLPDQRLVAIQSLEATDDDDLINGLIASNLAFRQMVARSKAGPRKPFPLASES